MRENDNAKWLDETDGNLKQSTVPTTAWQDAYPNVRVKESLSNGPR